MKNQSNENFIPYLIFGTLFGYLLSKAQATDYDSIIDMFRCREFQLWGVILTAITVIALGLFLLRFGFRGVIGMIILVIAFALLCWKFGPWALGTAAVLVLAGHFVLKAKGIPALIDQAQEWKPLAFEPSRLIGALIFGVGWALAGTCPGTALTQIGEGKVIAFFTVVGIFAGVWAYHKFKPISVAEDDVC